MPNVSQLPMGIRNNNPGNLRGYVNVNYNLGYRAGFAFYKNPDDGLKALFSEIYLMYTHHACITPERFAMRYAPPSENNSFRYRDLICQRMMISPLKAKTYDMRLDQMWNAFNLARAIVWIENGNPPSSYQAAPDWYEPTDYANAQLDAGYWGAKV